MSTTITSGSGSLKAEGFGAFRSKTTLITTSGTFIVPKGARQLSIQVIGGGGGGGGSGNPAGGNGSSGTASTLVVSGVTLTAGGGSGGIGSSTTLSYGGTASGGILNVSGGYGPGGYAYGCSTGPGYPNINGFTGNLCQIYGFGGGNPGTTTNCGVTTGAVGGTGAYVSWQGAAPSAGTSISVTVGIGGGGGSAGGGGTIGNKGGCGVVAIQVL